MGKEQNRRLLPSYSSTIARLLFYTDLPTPKAQNECDQPQNVWENECKGYMYM